MLFLSCIVLAQDTPDDASEVVVIEQAHVQGSAADRELDRNDVVAMPGRGADDLLRATRGLHQSAHGGHGKAFQYFLRGFDAVHGADLSIGLEGVPLNEVSNVHGHGYLDLHFLPRGLVRKAVLTPGVNLAEVGDFGVAGSGQLSLGLQHQGLQVQAGVGSDRSGSFAVGFRPEGRGPGTFGWVDGEGGAGVGSGRRWRQLRTGMGVDGQAGPVDLRAFALVYRGDFDSPGVLLEKEIESGQRDTYDAYPGSGGGLSLRALGATVASLQIGRWRAKATLWTGWRRLELRQNYTGFYDFPETGDATLQAHEALSGGGSARVDWAAKEWIGLSMGVDARIDGIHQTEAGIDTNEEVWDERFDTNVDQRSAGGWLSLPTRPHPLLALEAGLRVQHFQVRLDRALDTGLGTGKARANAPVVAPRGLVRVFPDGPVTFFVGAGRGFRSPEARGVETGRAPVPVSDGGEISSVAHLWDRKVELRGGAFGTWISNEIVFDHANARFLTTGSTRRLGGYGGLSVHPLEWLHFDLDVTASDGRYTDDSSPIPYAPRVLIVGQVQTEELVTGPLVWTSGLRAFVLTPRPLPGGHASHTAAVADLSVRSTYRSFWVDFDLENVFGSRWRDGEFFYASDWAAQRGGPVSGLPRRHITAGAPRVARLGVGWRL